MFPALMICILEGFATVGTFVPSWNKLPEHHVGHGSVPGKLMSQVAVSCIRPLPFHHQGLATLPSHMLINPAFVPLLHAAQDLFYD